MAVKENTCVLACLLYKLVLMPLISSKSEPLCVYLHTSCYRPTKGKDIRIFAGRWLCNPGVHSCRHLPVPPHRYTRCCEIHTLPAAWHSFMLELLAPAHIHQSHRLFGYGHIWWKVTEWWRITPTRQLSVYICCCWDPGWALALCREEITWSLSHCCAALRWEQQSKPGCWEFDSEVFWVF